MKIAPDPILYYNSTYALEQQLFICSQVPASFTLYIYCEVCCKCIIPSTSASHVQCAGVNGDNYQGAFSEPVSITVEPPEPQEGIV